MTGTEGLSRLVQPRSVAIVGLSADPQKHGARVLDNLRRFGFDGPIWGVNPRATVLHGIPTYPSLRDVPGRPDVVVLAVPASQVLGAIEAAGELGVGGAILFGGGFAETGAQGAALQRQVTDAARAGGVRLLGPNSAGVINASAGVVLSFLTCLERPADQLRAGPVGLVTQSGGTASYLHNLAAERGGGLAVTISTGNEGDIQAGEALGHLVEQSEVRAVALLLETVRDGPAFVAAALAALAAGKPVVVCKLGRSRTGDRVMRTHTGALAGPQRRFDAVFDALGITTTDTPEQLYDVAELLARCRVPEGRGVGIVTHSGGTAVLLADQVEALGVTLPDPSAQLQQRLAPYLQLGAAGNPTDLGGIITEPQRYAEVVRRFVEDAAFDVVVAASTPHPGKHAPGRARELAELGLGSVKPVLNLWLAGDIGAEGLAILRAAGVPVTTSVHSLATAVGGLVRFGDLRRRPPVAAVAADPEILARLGGPAKDPTGADKSEADLTEAESKALLGELGFPLLPGGLALSAARAAAVAEGIGFPVVAKVVARRIAHKTEAGGVRLNLSSAAEVEAACAQMLAAIPDLEGFLVEAYAPGLEMLLGVVRDPVFGPLVLVGAGGVHAEAVDDVAMGLPPLSREQAAQLLGSLGSVRLLRGFRGSPQADEQALAELLVRLSHVAVAYADEIDEIDLNPVIFAGGRWAVADALVRLTPEGRR